jgi:uncharacterized membrane protein
MPTASLLELAALLFLMVLAGLGRRYIKGWQRNACSVALVVLALITVFFVFFSAGAWIHAARMQPQ